MRGAAGVLFGGAAKLASAGLASDSGQEVAPQHMGVHAAGRLRHRTEYYLQSSI